MRADTTKYTKDFLDYQCNILGKTGNQVVIEFGLNGTVLYKKLKQYGIKTHKEKLNDLIPAIEKLHTSGMYVREIAKELSINEGFVFSKVKHLEKNGRFKDKLTKKYLTEEYINKDLSLVEIAQDIGCSIGTVGNFIKRHNLTKNESIEKTLTEEKLSNLYIDQNMSVYSIAKMFGMKYTATISKLLVKYEIPLRPRGHKFGTIEQKELKARRHPHMSSIVLSKLRSGAKKRNLEVKITIDDIWNIYLKQDKKCAISGVSVSFPTSHKEYMSYSTMASVDRIDSSKGYTIENIQIVHKQINMMKQSMSDRDFINWCRIICAHNEDNI